MSVSYTVDVKDPSHAADSLGGTLVQDFRVAANDWLQHLTGLGSIDFEIDIAPTAAGRAESAPASIVPFGTASDGTPLYEPGTLYELRTGIDPNGAAPDAVITIDPKYLLQQTWADPTPADTTDAVPADRVDLVSVLRHETGHMLGIISGASGTGSASWETTFDQQTVTRSDGTFFVGAHARAAYGGDVPVTTLPGEAHSHLGNSLAEPAGTDLMNGVAFYLGTRYQVSALDLAILEDIGAPVVSPTTAVAGAGGPPGPSAGDDASAGAGHHHDRHGPHRHHDQAAAHHHDPHSWGGHEQVSAHHVAWAHYDHWV